MSASSTITIGHVTAFAGSTDLCATAATASPAALAMRGVDTTFTDHYVSQADLPAADAGSFDVRRLARPRFMRWPSASPPAFDRARKVTPSFAEARLGDAPSRAPLESDSSPVLRFDDGDSRPRAAHIPKLHALELIPPLGKIHELRSPELTARARELRGQLRELGLPAPIAEHLNLCLREFEYVIALRAACVGADPAYTGLFQLQSAAEHSGVPIKELSTDQYLTMVREVLTAEGRMPPTLAVPPPRLSVAGLAHVALDVDACKHWVSAIELAMCRTALHDATMHAARFEHAATAYEAALLRANDEEATLVLSKEYEALTATILDDTIDAAVRTSLANLTEDWVRMADAERDLEASGKPVEDATDIPNGGVRPMDVLRMRAKLGTHVLASRVGAACDALGVTEDLCERLIEGASEGTLNPEEHAEYKDDIRALIAKALNMIQTPSHHPSEQIAARWMIEALERRAADQTRKELNTSIPEHLRRLRKRAMDVARREALSLRPPMDLLSLADAYLRLFSWRPGGAVERRSLEKMRVSRNRMERAFADRVLAGIEPPEPMEPDRPDAG